MRRPLSLALLALLLAACDPPIPRLSGSGMDMFAPTAVRLHPLSRIVTPPLPPISAGAASPEFAAPAPSILEARIELTDQFSDPTKSPGTLTLELFDQPPLTHKGPLLQSWPLSINTPEANRDHWDRTTRTYLFKLPITPLEGAALPKREHLLVTVTLTLPNGAVLTDEIELPLK